RRTKPRHRSFASSAATSTSLKCTTRAGVKTPRPWRSRILASNRRSPTPSEPGMSTKIFVNFPVTDLVRSVEFFKKLGFSFNPQFTDDTGACMVVSESAYVMLLTHPKFKQFAPNAISDATKSTEVLVALSCENRGKVDELVAKAVAAGG